VIFIYLGVCRTCVVCTNLVPMGPTVIVVLHFVFLLFKITGTTITTYHSCCSWYHISWGSNTRKCAYPCKASKFSSLALLEGSQFSKGLGRCRHGSKVRSSGIGKICQCRGNIRAWGFVGQGGTVVKLSTVTRS
jgi:hypothetical protein